MAMARKQTLIQLSDELLARLDTQAAREHRSRSEIVREAISAYLTSDPEAAIDARIVQGYTEHPQDAADAAWADAGTRAMLNAAGSWDDE
jgi:metal-responsive CopG/Arc/MetJ family transcriptional regulator